MKTLTIAQAKQMNFTRLSVALGTFDGLHIGHIALINSVKNGGGESAVFTFDALPIDIFQAGHRPMRLFTMDEKIEAFAKTGIDYLCVAHFDNTFAKIETGEFEQLLHDAFAPRRVVAGYNYTYGKEALGDAQTLVASGAAQGYETEVVPPVILDGEPVSSTRIRECIWAGDIRGANAMLGYEYAMSGEVMHGRGIGRTLGFPTANISASQEKIVPADGVYAADVVFGERLMRGVCNVGTNPTISSDNKTTVEVHILDFDEDIYGQFISVRFDRRIRGEVRFESRDQLVAQIGKDVAAAKIAT